MLEVAEAEGEELEPGDAGVACPEGEVPGVQGGAAAAAAAAVRLGKN